MPCYFDVSCFCCALIATLSNVVQLLLCVVFVSLMLESVFCFDAVLQLNEMKYISNNCVAYL